MKKDKKYTAIVVLLIVSMFISWSLYFKSYKQEDKVQISLFPKEFAGWNSEEMKITDDEYAILETKNAFVRRYFNPSGDEVYMFIVYSESNRKVSHPPEVCYIGSGATVTSSTHAELPADNGAVVKTNRLILEQGNNVQVANYWFKVGNTFTSNYWKQQILIALKTLLGQPTSSALIRVSATVKNEDLAGAEQAIEKFSSPMIPKLFQFLP